MMILKALYIGAVLIEVSSLNVLNFWTSKNFVNFRKYLRDWVERVGWEDKD